MPTFQYESPKIDSYNQMLIKCDGASKFAHSIKRSPQTLASDILDGQSILPELCDILFIVFHEAEKNFLVYIYAYTNIYTCGILKLAINTDSKSILIRHAYRCRRHIRHRFLFFFLTFRPTIFLALFEAFAERIKLFYKIQRVETMGLSRFVIVERNLCNRSSLILLEGDRCSRYLRREASQSRRVTHD